MSRGRALTTTALLVGSLVAAAPAWADPPPVRGGDGNVETVVGTPGSPGSQGGGSGQPVGNGGPVPCTYTALTPEQAVAAGMPTPDDLGEAAGGDGSYYMRDCSASAGGRVIVWIANGPGPVGVPTVTPAELAVQARNTLRLPTPQVRVSPDGQSQNPALVNLPTWWWVDNDATLTQRTAVGPVWAEVTATPYATSWVASDGARQDCPTLGVAWESWMSESQSGSCRFTYRTARESETATVEMVWQVTWVGSAGTSGELAPMRVSGQHTMPVYERQAILTGD